MKSQEQTEVVVVGAGFAGLHAAFSIRKARPAVRVSVISKSEVFVYRPDSVYIPFGLDPDSLCIPVQPPLAAQDIGFVHGAVTDLDATQRLVTVPGRQVPYDYLLIATGSEIGPRQVPGLLDHAHDVNSLAPLLALRRAVLQMVADAVNDRPTRVLFLVPPGTHFSGPLYEMALLLDRFLDRQDYRSVISITVATWEARCLQALGDQIHNAVWPILESHHVDILTDHVATQVEARHATFQDGHSLPFDVLVTASAPGGSLAVRDLSYDSDGFIRTDVWNRLAEGQSNIFVAGDAAAHDLKQGYVAYAQADVAAHHIVSRIKGEPPHRYYEPRSRYIMDGFDTAIYIDSSLDDRAARVTSSRLWSISKQILGRYLPWRVRRGEPFTSVFERPSPSAVYPR